MSVGYLEAEDEIFGIANAAFIAAAEGEGLDYAPGLVFPGQLVPPPDPTKINAVCSFVVVTDGQAGIGNPGGISLYETVGLFVLQLYAPKPVASAFRTAKIIAEQVRDAFTKPSPSGEVWFRNQKLTAAAGNETYNQVNVIVVCTFKSTK